MRITLNRSRSKGASMVEFAFISSILFLVIFSIFEFGRYMFVEHTINYAAQEGARTAMTGGTASAINTKITKAAEPAVKAGLKLYIYPVTAPAYTDPDGVTVSPRWDTYLYPGGVSLGIGGDYRKLRIQYAFDFIIPLIKRFFPGGQIVIDATVLYRNEKF